MEFKGTKGKWELSTHSDEKKWHNIKSEKGVFARTFYGELHPIITELESEANAKLISCAPEMLEMLMVLNQHLMDIHGYQFEMQHHVEQLIEKATTI